MDQEQQIIEIAKIIEDWNPLGEAANSIDQLEGYRYEAMDILSQLILPMKRKGLKWQLKLC